MHKTTKSYDRFQRDLQSLRAFHSFVSTALPAYVEQVRHFGESVRNGSAFKGEPTIEKVDGPGAPRVLKGLEAERMSRLVREFLARVSFDEAESKAGALRESIQLVNEQTVVYAVSLLETYLSDLAVELSFDALPLALFRREKNQILKAIICDRIDAMRSVDEKVKFIKATFNITVEKSPVVQEIIQTRHLLAHKRGTVDEKYRKRAQRRDLKVGAKREVASDEVASALDAINLFVQSIDNQANR
jgi:hypothetical protein